MMGVAQQAQLFLDDRDSKRRIFSDLHGHGIGECVQFISRHQVVENAKLPIGLAVKNISRVMHAAWADG